MSDFDHASSRISSSMSASAGIALDARGFLISVFDDGHPAKHGHLAEEHLGDLHQQAGKFGLPKAVELACPARPAKAHHELLAQPALHAALERRVRFSPG